MLKPLGPLQMHQRAGQMTEPDRFLLLPSLHPMRLPGFSLWLVFSQSPSYPGIEEPNLFVGERMSYSCTVASDIFTPGFKVQIPWYGASLL
jgi:hypothetical protein